MSSQTARQIADATDRSAPKLTVVGPPPARPPTIAQIALPSILGNLMFAIVGMVQTKFVGELGPDAVAAVGVGQRIFFALQAIMMAVSVGTTALVARAWGAGDYDEASRVTTASLALSMVFALILTMPGILFAEPVAALFGLSAETTKQAADYIFWLSVFNVAFAVNIIIGAVLRAAGDAWTPLWIGLGVNVVNVVFLYVLVLGKFGFPAMGAPGTALAGGLTLAIAAVVQLILWQKQKFVVKFLTGGWFRRERYRRLVNIGYPAAIEMMVFQIGFFFFFSLLGNYHGTEAFAAYSVGANVLQICMVVGFGFSIAGATLVGQHLGANDAPGAVRSGWLATLYSAIGMGSLGWVMAFYSTDLASFFLQGSPETVELTAWMIIIMGLSLPLLAVEFAVGGSLRGAGDTRIPLMATILGLATRCMLAVLFTMLGWHVVWVFGTLVGDYLVKAVILLWRFASGKWQKVLSA
ncbi:MAG: MATE family efflux transporter [Proteobacteria bacterium]|jgi:putative MATE family efflux protein|nr:MATE family efflux transporter [Pseudomonadota bacterium]